jgi:hypothetical protein
MANGIDALFQDREDNPYGSGGVIQDKTELNRPLTVSVRSGGTRLEELALEFDALEGEKVEIACHVEGYVLTKTEAVIGLNFAVDSVFNRELHMMQRIEANRHMRFALRIYVCLTLGKHIIEPVLHNVRDDSVLVQVTTGALYGQQYRGGMVPVNRMVI